MMRAPDPSRRRHRRWQCLLALSVSAGLTQLVACTQTPPTPTHAARIEGAPGQPVVFHAQSARDAAAYRQSERELAPAQYGILEHLGPHPVWDKFNTDRASTLRDAAENSPAATAVADASDSIPMPMPLPVSEFPMPATQPATTLPSTRPTTAPTPGPTPARAGPAELYLPVAVVPLPESKIRLVWTLRSYGGSTVAIARDAATARRTVTVTPPDLTALVAALTPQLGAGGTVIPLPRENTLVITCDRRCKESVLDLLDRLDVPQRQVEITAKIFEVSQDFDYQQGAQLIAKHLSSDNSQNLTSTFSTQRFLDAAAKGGTFQGGVLQLMQTLGDSGISLESAFQLLQDVGLIKVVSAPRMVVATGQTGYMLAGQELPIQSAQTNGSTILTSTTYKPVGVQLYITPQAIGNNRIKLHAVSIVSSVSGFTPLPAMFGGHTDPESLINPIIDSREAETAVTITNGDTLVISGLRMVRTTTREEKIPGLGDIPLLGWLFKNHRSQQQMTDLYFFVTPTLL